MPLYRFLTRFVLPLTCAVCVAPVWAQEKMAQPVSLTEALQTLPLNWNPSEKGALFWVILSYNTEPSRLKQGSANSFTVQTVQSPEPLQVGRNGVFRVQDIAIRFDRHMVSARTVTAFAPTLTTTLATRLPAPDFEARLSQREKLRRLEATLTPAQWRKMGSPSGLGLADLQAAQQKRFSALLPAEFIIGKRSNEGIGDRVTYSGDTVSHLSPTQQAGMRIVMSRHLEWYFTNLKGGMVYTAPPVAGPEGAEVLTLVEAAPVPSAVNSQSAIFGVPIKEILPDHAKPSQLVYEDSALNAGVVLADAKNVGDLIQQIKQKTGVGLFCDPRYRDLLFYTKGGEQTVRAGDALQAVAAAVSGTFRKVDDGETAAYVLTDDLEGLGTRQARIAEWLQAAAMERDTETQKMEAALSKVKIGDYLAWAGDDPNAPLGKLAERIEAYRMGRETGTVPDKSPAGRENDSGRTGLWVPLADLPASVQNAIGRQKQAYDKKVQEEQAENKEFRFYEAPLRTDRVQLHVNTSVTFVIPGVGRVEASLGGRSSLEELLPSPPPAPQPAADAKPKNPPKQTPPFRLAQAGGSLRALLVALPLDESGAAGAVASAKVHGFTQLWVELPVGNLNPRFLTETIALAKAQKMQVQAVVPVLRGPADRFPDVSRDRNRLNETTTQWATRRMAIPVLDAQSEGDSIDRFLLRQWKVIQTNASRQKERGDFLDITDRRTSDAVLSDLLTVARTPDLAGVVACDLVSPGRDGNVSHLLYNEGVQSAVEDFGYSSASRLRFLQETGVDPVDLSPLPDGDLPRIYSSAYSHSGQAANVHLPQMPDYGLSTGGRTINGVSADMLGAKNNWSVWNAFRKAQTDLFWSGLQERFAAAAPGVSLVRLNENRRVALRDRPVSLSQTGSQGRKNGQNKAADAPAQNRRAYLCFRYDPNPAEAFLQPFDRGAGGFFGLLSQALQPYQNKWDGLVIDLSGVPLDEALPLLQSIAAGAAPPAPPAPKKADSP